MSCGIVVSSLVCELYCVCYSIFGWIAEDWQGVECFWLSDRLSVFFVES